MGGGADGNNTDGSGDNNFSFGKFGLEENNSNPESSQPQNIFSMYCKSQGSDAAQTGFDLFKANESSRDSGTAAPSPAFEFNFGGGGESDNTADGEVFNFGGGGESDNTGDGGGFNFNFNFNGDENDADTSADNPSMFSF